MLRKPNDDNTRSSPFVGDRASDARTAQGAGGRARPALSPADCAAQPPRAGDGLPTTAAQLGSMTMKVIRTLTRAALIAATFSMQAAHAQGVPVIDLQAIAQAISTVKQLEQQYSLLSDQYQSTIGNRGLGNIFNDPSLRNYLPDQWQSVYDEVKSGQLNGISGLASTIESQEGMTAYTPGQQRLNDTLAANKAMAMRSYQASIDRLTNIQQLMQQSNLTQDPAAKADLQNRWAAENSSINAEKMRLDLAARLQDAEKDFAQQAAHNDMQQRLNGDENADQ
ncbi:type IV secretion system protein [Paraburkholderia sp. EG286B]|uniref:type IV secretion system protein n=1 Tax=unclassified Paraburkholderia TaxID=2615204 RepID=UPI0034D1F7AF